jgi:hypothetical protein
MDSQVSADSVRVTMACLLRLIEQLGVQALSGRQDGVDNFERDVRSQLFAHLADVRAGETAAGVALAHTLVEPILRRLREASDPRRDATPFDRAEPPPAGKLN